MKVSPVYIAMCGIALNSIMYALHLTIKKKKKKNKKKKKQKKKNIRGVIIIIFHTLKIMIREFDRRFSLISEKTLIQCPVST